MDTRIFDFARQQAEICKVFGNANRILILWVLGGREMSVGDIADAIESSLQNTSQHLRLMKDKGILVSRREQHTIYYCVAEHDLVKACGILQCVLDGQLPSIANPLLRHRIKNTSQEGLPMTNIDLSTVTAAKVVDARGSACPGPLLEAKKGIGAVAVGQVLEVWSGDPNTKNDIPQWAQKIGHEFLGVLAADGYDRIFIKRSK
jgi:TusA-related sulfurtransferase/DNA-binding transcriptional ArsR family regulator